MGAGVEVVLQVAEDIVEVGELSAVSATYHKFALTNRLYHIMRLRSEFAP